MKTTNLFQFRTELGKNIVMIKNYSEIEQLQNELQWWGEQKLQAFQEGDLKYMNECREAEKQLIEDIDKINEDISYSKNL
jgi:hypothetical protein